MGDVTTALAVGVVCIMLFYGVIDNQILATILGGGIGLLVFFYLDNW